MFAGSRACVTHLLTNTISEKNKPVFNNNPTPIRRESVKYAFEDILYEDPLVVDALIEKNTWIVCESSHASGKTTMSNDAIGYMAEESTWMQLMSKHKKPLEEFPFSQRRPPCDWAEGMVECEYFITYLRWAERALEVKQGIDRLVRKIQEYGKIMYYTLEARIHVTSGCQGF